MQAIDVHNQLFVPDNFKYVEINKTPRTLQQRKYIGGIKNAQKLIDGLEHSLKKSNEYENRLLKCRISHNHLHDTNDSKNSEDSDTKESKPNTDNNSKSPSSVFDLTGSWSTISIVCLQHQYEELSKRYNNLLKAHNDHCNLLNFNDIELLKLRKRLKKAHAEVIKANESILTVGYMYLNLKNKKINEKVLYEDRIDSLKGTIRAILVAVERARLELYQPLAQRAPREDEAAIDLLLSEIKTNNLLLLENLKLKYQITKTIATKNDEQNKFASP